MPADFSLTGRVVVVTGASRGIGEEIARGAAAAGASVVPLARKQEALDPVAASSPAAAAASLSPRTAELLEAKLTEGIKLGLGLPIEAEAVEELARLDTHDALLRASLKQGLHLSDDKLGYEAKDAPAAESAPAESNGVVVTGISLGLPNHDQADRTVFDPRNLGSIFAGENFISELTRADKQSIIDMNVVQIAKKDGKRVEIPINRDAEIIQVASKIGKFDLAAEYGLPLFFS